MNNNGLSLKKITDFDCAFGGSDNDFMRIPDLCEDVSLTEVNLITWLLLEKEYNKINVRLDAKSNKLNDFLPGPGGDVPDAVAPKSIIQTAYDGFSKHKLLTKYAEELLRAVGVFLPFELLTEGQRNALFRLFSSQSKLLRQEKYSTILDLYEALRRRSKFREEFDILDTLGQGEFGVVYAVQARQPERPKYAVKQINISCFDAYDDIMMALNESKTLQKLGPHPNIVGYADAWIEVLDDEKEPLVPVFFLMMELGYLPLNRWRDENPNATLSHECITRITTQLVCAIEWIHNKKCLHLDINPKNILWSDATFRSVKIADFGLAVHADTCSDRRGTIPYYAPESCFSAKSDVYSLGVTLLEISQNISTKSELIRRIESGKLQTEIHFLDKVLPLMLEKDPSRRPTASEIIQILY